MNVFQMVAAATRPLTRSWESGKNFILAQAHLKPDSTEGFAQLAIKGSFAFNRPSSANFLRGFLCKRPRSFVF
jgi:hypothetical protein